MLETSNLAWGGPIGPWIHTPLTWILAEPLTPLQEEESFAANPNEVHLPPGASQFRLHLSHSGLVSLRPSLHLQSQAVLCS
jgi:hypothetical protein